MIGSWTRIFAFWRVAKVKYEYFGRWRAGETLYYTLELCPWVFAKSFNCWSLSWWSKQRLIFIIEFCVSFEFIVSNTTKTSSYFSLHSFSSSLTFWNMLTIINYYNIFVSWLSQSKLKKKENPWKQIRILSSQVSRSTTCDNSRHSEYSCAGSLHCFCLESLLAVLSSSSCVYRRISQLKLSQSKPLYPYIQLSKTSKTVYQALGSRKDFCGNHATVQSVVRKLRWRW